MVSFILWYLAISGVGWLTFPVAFRLLPGLADRGYAFTRTLGWLVWGYLFWLLASLGVLRNDLGGLVFALLALGAISVWAWRGLGRGELRAWLGVHRRLVLLVELLFLAAFAGLAAVRAANPEIFGTEKPMELAFINAILHSPVFPPHDPWLSGYAISYYYFGYVLVAMLAQLTGVTGGVAFNLGIALVFALSASGAYGMVYNLLVSVRPAKAKTESDPKGATGRQGQARLALPLFGPVYILLASNLEGFLEVLHARGLFPAGFWKWLDILEINTAPAPPYSWVPRLFGTGNWWWWRASRVLQDYDFSHNPIEIIDEFPVFSYILADLHPHVLAMPFAFLAMALALNLFLGGGRGRFDLFYRRISARGVLGIAIALGLGGLALIGMGMSGGGLRLGLLGVLGFVAGGLAFVRWQPSQGKGGLGMARRGGEVAVGMPFDLNGAFFLVSAATLGGLAFLNTWDFPIYVALLAAAYSLRRRKGEVLVEKAQAVGMETMEAPGTSAVLARTLSSVARDFVTIAVAIGLAGIALYLPFYLGFSSQANGILPNLIYPTTGAHLWVMFAPLLLPAVAFLIFLWKRHRPQAGLIRGLSLALGFGLVCWAFSLLLAAAAAALPGLGDLFLSRLGAPGLAAALGESVRRRLASPGGWISATLLLAGALALLAQEVDWGKWLGTAGADRGAGEQETMERDPSPRATLGSPLSTLESPHVFALLLILLGALLILGPEFFYLLDQFGTRMNTIFKFYYQAWLLLGIAAAYGTVVLLQDLRRVGLALFSVGLAVILLMSLTYTTFALWDKTHGFNPPDGWTLDGTAFLKRSAPDEMDAVHWLGSAPPGPVAEAVGGSYSSYARISMLSGQPSVLGWPGHESQWRGGGVEMGSRMADLERLYCTRSWEEAQSVIDRYDIRYVYIGTLERTTYVAGKGACAAGLEEAKFARYLTPVFKQGDAVIYEVPQ